MQVLHNFDGVVSDLDGVFFHGGRIQDGTKDFVDAVRMSGRKITFASNGTGGPQAVVDKFALGGIDVSLQDVVTAGCVTARYLAELQCQSKDDLRFLMLTSGDMKKECMTRGVRQLLTQDDVWDAGEGRWIAKHDPTHLVVSRHDYR
jgi:ribonucleotide monophosphatase NagD (HAD superfamily)